jgi:hypothetical protein
MMRFEKLLICGCARSGNTLLLNLIANGFANTLAMRDEQLPVKHSDVMTVGKRPLELKNVDLHVQTMGVILTMRHPKDVLLSIRDRTVNQPHVRPERWIESAELIAEFETHPQARLVYYEKLIQSPNAVQKELSEFLDLKITHPFQTCHQYFDQRDTKNVEAMHGIRPLDVTRVLAWKNQRHQKGFLNELYDRYPKLAHLEYYFYQSRLPYL